MALNIEKEANNSGISVEYWKICEVFYNVENKECRVILKAYKDSSSRQAGKDPILSHIFLFDENNNPLPTAEINVVAACYVALKAEDPYFAGAQDA